MGHSTVLASFAALGIGLSLLLPACASDPADEETTPIDEPGDDAQDQSPGDGKFDGPGSTPGTKLVLRGTVLTMDEARGNAQVIDNGAVVIEGGKISKVLTAGQPLPTGSDVTVLPSATGASDWVISPGLINLHNHLAYNTAHIYRELSLYENTYQWRDEKYYDTHIMYPKKVFESSTASPTEFGLPGATKRVSLAGVVGRYTEVKELVSGTTSTQGSFFGIKLPSGYGLHLARNVDSSNFGVKRVSQTALGILVYNFDPRPLVKKFDANSVDAWLVHLAEGTDQESSDEFECLDAMGLVREQTVIIHGTALSTDQLKRMAQAGSKLIASPVDNLLYYGKVPDIVEAHRVGVNVSIGSDWSPAGSKNLLSELKTLDMLNQQAWGGELTDDDMLRMVTTNPADAIGWTKNVGRIKPGLWADIAVYKKRPGAAQRSVIDATEADVRLVMVAGDPLVGDVAVMKKLKKTDYEVVQGCGFEKAIDITTSDTRVEYGKITFQQVVSTLEQGLKFDAAWMQSHWEPARTAGATGGALADLIDDKYPRGLEPRTLDPLFVCQDKTYIEELRTDPNIRTAEGGLCFDLRPKYLGTSTASCGTPPAKPKTLTVAMHDGTVPQRPPAWCAQQNWSGSGSLPTPP